jgi:hypothetical protein
MTNQTKKIIANVLAGVAAVLVFLDFFVGDRLENPWSTIFILAPLAFIIPAIIISKNLKKDQ